MLEGKPGTTVTLSVVRPRKPDPDKITLTRAVVCAPALSRAGVRELHDPLPQARRALTADRVDEIAAKIKSAGKSRKILLDLRDCYRRRSGAGRAAGQLLHQAGHAGHACRARSFRSRLSPPIRRSSLPTRLCAVLVNRGTYGAAELAAAAIEDLKRGDVVGERTFGEGSVQKTIELPDGAALMLTVAKYEGPAGKKIQDEAVTAQRAGRQAA